MVNAEEISEQYLYVAFQPGQRRGYRRTKNQQIYGVFNQESDDEETSSSDRYKKKIKTDDYTAPVGFVKGKFSKLYEDNDKSKLQKERFIAGTGQSMGCSLKKILVHSPKKSEKSEENPKDPPKITEKSKKDPKIPQKIF